MASRKSGLPATSLPLQSCEVGYINCCDPKRKWRSGLLESRDSSIAEQKPYSQPTGQKVPHWRVVKDLLKLLSDGGMSTEGRLGYIAMATWELQTTQVL